MKKYIYILLSALLVVFAASCQKTSEGKTQVVSYFQMYGASTMYLGVGDEFVDPGIQELDGGGHVVTTITDMNGDEVAAVSTEEPGFFAITYSTVNDQDLYFEKTRMVYIYDATVTETLGTFKVDGAASYYKVPAGTYSVYAANYGGDDSATITFKQVAGNIYTCSDLLGGWYTWVRGYGPAYGDSYGWDYFDMKGFITLNADMTVSLLSSSISAWGDSLIGFGNGEYDPETKRISWDWQYTSAVYGHVEMVQQ